MESLFAFLLLTSLICLIVGLIKPDIFSRLIKKELTRKNIGLIFGGAFIVLFVLIAIITEPTEEEATRKETTVEQEKEAEEKEVDPKEEAERVVTDYSILREWNPDNDSDALGLEILISEKDVSKENITNLIKDIAGTKGKVNIKVYQSKEAWDEEKSGEYTEEYDRGYLAFYIKNKTDSGAYRGFNEIRWLQAEGDLSYLFGEKTKF